MFQIQIQDDCVYSHLTKSFNAPFCICYENNFFPDEEWTDFPVAIICMWIDQMRSILEVYQSHQKFNLFFLDGDFHLECIVCEDKLSIEMFSGNVHQNDVSIWVKDFLRALLRAINKIELLMERHQYEHSSEYDTLEEKKKWVVRYLKK